MSSGNVKNAGWIVAERWVDVWQVLQKVAHVMKDLSSVQFGCSAEWINKNNLWFASCFIV